MCLSIVFQGCCGSQHCGVPCEHANGSICQCSTLLVMGTGQVGPQQSSVKTHKINLGKLAGATKLVEEP